MEDPISDPIVLVVFTLGLIVMLWTWIAPRKVFDVLNFYSRAPTPSDAMFRVVRSLAALCAIGVAILILAHLIRSR
jgi:type II secretory pathway component PulF